MLIAGGHNVNTGGFDATMAKDICQFGDIFFNTVESTGKQLSEIVWVYLTWAYVGPLSVIT